MCDRYFVMLLPPQAGGWNSYSFQSPDWLIDRAKACPLTVVADAVEGWLKSPGEAQRVRALFGNRRQWFAGELVYAVRGEFQKDYESLRRSLITSTQEQVESMRVEKIRLSLEVGRLDMRLRSLRRRLRRVTVPLVEGFRAHGHPVLAECVDESGEVGVYIEDGRVAAVNGQAVEVTP
jgi:hypothetical protein